ncbi:HEXXH motif domain-containing protein [Streptomyces sp. NBC_00056]|uniref:HEXXH motif domain-containing protein n=1 Tax=unclassified Streptomyces TaxID=2593676 RepID=UPI002E308BD4|nr:HEXXH motif domain-containing protein [Streptomyces sp. NBC_01280]
MLTRHHVSVADLEAIATGRITAPTGTRIAAAERSRRMLMLRALAAAEREAEESGGPLPPLAHAFELLARAEALDPHAVASVLRHPPVGVWAVRLLGRLQGGVAGPRPGEPPLWREAGYAHALAAAAALRAGLPARVRLPAWAGKVILPTVGHAVLDDAPGDHDVATLETDGRGPARVTLGPHTLELPADPHLRAPGWHPARLLSWTPREPGPAVLLDDADPYRDFRSPWPPPAPLTDGESDTWQRHLHDAARLLGARHPDAARTVPLVLNSLVPLPGMPRFRTSSASYAEAFGSALVSLPRDAVDFAVTLVHESRHSVLNGLSHQIQLVDRAARGPRQDTLLYAPWRTDPRPPWGLLHGTYAFTGVADFWRTERHALAGPRAVLAHFEFAVWRDAVAIALRTLAGQPGLTPWGRSFVTEMARQTVPWADDDVPAEAFAPARAELADLRSTWCSHNLAPDPAATRLLADHRLGGGPGEEVTVPPSRPRADPPQRQPELRCELRRLHIADAGTFTPDTLARLSGVERSPDLLEADMCLLRGGPANAARAVDRYRAVLTGAPATRPAWVGLGLALEASGEGETATSLLHRPELVRALALEERARGARTPDPLELARWTARIPGLITQPATGVPQL